MRKMVGVSLIEVIVFLVVVGIAVTSIFLALSTAISSNVNISPQMIANYLAQARMEIILGQKSINGFSSFTDICASGTPPAVCTIPAVLTTAGYAYTPAPTISSGTTTKTIRVTVIGPQNVKAVMTTEVRS